MKVEFTVYKKGVTHSYSHKMIEVTVKKTKEEFLSEYNNLKSLIENNPENKEKLNIALDSIMHYYINDLKSDESLQHFERSTTVKELDKVKDKAVIWANLSVFCAIVPPIAPFIVSEFIIPAVHRNIDYWTMITLILVVVSVITTVLTVVFGIFGVKGDYKRGFIGILVGIYGVVFVIPNLISFLLNLFKGVY